MAIKVRKKHLFLLLLCLLLILGFFTFFGEKGILHLLRLQKELARIKEMNIKMGEENQKLKEEVRRLEHEKRYIEEIARKELGMVKEGEIIYLFDLPIKGEGSSCNPQIRRVFLADGDALILPQKELLRILEYLKARLKRLERIGIYANA